MAATTFPNGWLNFELNVLRRLKFSSIALPFTGEPDLSIQLKRWGVRVAANDQMSWAFTKVLALVENSSERLSDEDINCLVDDAYVPHDRLDNPSLANWFNETDAWWFDTVRFNAERLGSTYKRALALTLGMMVGDYVLSFDEDSRHLREPLSLSLVFRRLAAAYRFLMTTLTDKACKTRRARFCRRTTSYRLLFLRLRPLPRSNRKSLLCWREEWMLGGNDFWDEMREPGRPTWSRVQAKTVPGLCRRLLHTAAHIPAGPTAHTDNGFISTDEMAKRLDVLRNGGSSIPRTSGCVGRGASIVTAAT